jgi:hypothetical protein
MAPLVIFILKMELKSDVDAATFEIAHYIYIIYININNDSYLMHDNRLYLKMNRLYQFF